MTIKPVPKGSFTIPKRFRHVIQADEPRFVFDIERGIMVVDLQMIGAIAEAMRDPEFDEIFSLVLTPKVH